MSRPIERTKSVGGTGAVSDRRHSLGFTLIEVLVAVVVLAIGLLGMAALQTFGMNQVQDSSVRTQSNQDSYNIVDRMRANMSGVIAGDYIISKDQDSAVWEPAYDCEGDFTGTAVANRCSPAELALADLYYWKTQLQAHLGPVWSLSVQCADPATPTVPDTECPSGHIHTISVGWQDQERGAAGAVDKSIIGTLQL